MKGYELIDFPRIGDGQGFLVALEEKNNIPFEIKRVYFIYDTPKDIVRGKHAHRILQQVIFCLKGSCDFTLDNGKEKLFIRMNKPERGLYIKNSMWREFTNFSPDCVLMILASEHYNEKDYIRNYEEFLKEVSN